MFLLYSGLGDTYGMGFEFQDKPFENTNNLKKLYEHPIQKQLGESLRLHAGWYTDDTEMSMAVAEALVENSVDDLTPLVFANKFVELFQTRRRHGYAQGFYGFLNSIDSGQEFLLKINPSSNRNGAAMRSGPLGFLAIRDLLKISDMQARTTHNTLSAVISSQIIALMYHYTLYSLGAKKDIVDFIRTHLSEYYRNYEEPYGHYLMTTEKTPETYINQISLGTTGETSLTGFSASLSVLDLFVKNHKASTALLEAVDRAGDTDTAGALVCGLAYLSNEYELDLPRDLMNTFISKEPEIARLIQDDVKLYNKFVKERENESWSHRFKKMEKWKTGE